jgi:peptidoglycan/xylan/chitin deacetylase (PgdA/CDA1 family)
VGRRRGRSHRRADPDHRLHRRNPLPAPNGKKLFALPNYLARHHRTTITWDVAPDSDGIPDAATVERAVVDQVRPGSIVVLHAMYASREQTRQAIGPILDTLKQRGFRFVTVSQLLSRPSPAG